MLKIEMMSRMLVCDDDDLVHGEDVGPEGNTAAIE